MDTLAIILLISSMLTFAVGAVLLIVLIVMAVRKSPLKRIGIATGSVFGVFALSIIGIIILITVRAGMDLTDDTTASNGNNPTPVEPQHLNRDEEDDEEERNIDLSTYEEADRDMVNANEYEEGTSLKLTDAHVISIVPSDDHPGNDIVVQIDDGDGLLLNDIVGREEIEEGSSYTFYGPPNGESGLIIVAVE